MAWVKAWCSFCGARDWCSTDEDGLCASCLTWFDEERELEEARRDGSMPSLPALYRRSPARLD